MEPAFVTARVGDIDAVLGMMRRFYAIDGYPFDAAIARSAVNELMANPSYGRLWVIRLGADVVGYVALTLSFSLLYHGRDAWVDELFIEEGHRGRGIGRLALALVEQTCRDLRIDALHLEVERDNEPALALYRRLGFQGHGRDMMTRWISG